MRLPKFAIENHQFTIVIIVLLVLSGIVSFMTMPRSEDPKINPKGTNIIAVYPGATPEDLEELVVDPIEEAVNEIEDIKHIKTSAVDGLAIIEVEFTVDVDMDEKYSEISQKVNGILSELPDELARLELLKWSITDVKILQVGLVSDSLSYSRLEEEADRLKDEFEKTAGIKKIETFAYPEQQVHVSLDLERIAQQGISINRVLGAIQSNNSNIPGGNIDIGNKRFNIQTSGSYENIDEIRNTVVDAYDGKVVYLKDIADVNYGYEDDVYYARVNGTRAVFVTATQKAGTNIFDVKEGLENKLNEFKNDLPAGLEVYNVFDQSDSVSYRLDTFFSNLLQGLVLVGLVVLLAVGFRASIIVMLAIPISIFIGIAFLDWSDFGLQQMSIAGLVIALGLLVDNAIVVTENVARFRQKGFNEIDSAVEGTRQVAWAIVSATVTTVLAFVPMMMIGDVTGDFIRSMPLTVVFTLGASLFISLSLTPYLTSKFLSGKRSAKIGTGIVQVWINKLIETRYRKTLSYSLGKPVLIIILAVIIFLGSVSLFPLIGISFFPKAEKPQFLVNVNLPEGTSINKTNETTKFVEMILKEQKHVKTVAANIGHGNPRIYYNQFQKNEKSNLAQILVELDTRDLEIFDGVISDLRNKFTRYPGAKIEVVEFEQGPPVDAPIAIRIIGEDLDELKRISRDIEQFYREVPGVINIDNPLATTKTDLRVKINREKAGMYGVPVSEIDKTVRAAMTGLSVSKFRDNEGKEYDIVVRLPVNGIPEITDFNRIWIPSQTGKQVPLNQVASIQFESSPLVINHFNLERNVTITAGVESGVEVNSATLQIIDKLKEYDFPRGYRYYVGGELESRQQSFGGMLQAVIIAMVGIFAVLVLQFKSYSQPMIVFSAIPLALTGSFIALLATGYTFSFTAFVGLTSLVGIVVNNSIILVDYTNQLLKDGRSIVEALQEAGETRFTPIVLTTLTTIGGLLPLTIAGGTMWAPMGWTIIGGLLVSTFLTLIVVPVLYKVFTKEERAQTA